MNFTQALETPNVGPCGACCDSFWCEKTLRLYMIKYYFHSIWDVGARSTVLTWSFPCSKEKTEISICEQRLVVRGKLLEDATLVSSIEGRIFLARAAGAEQPSSPATTEEVEEITLVIKKLGCSLETILTVTLLWGTKCFTHKRQFRKKVLWKHDTLFYLSQDQIT